MLSTNNLFHVLRILLSECNCTEKRCVKYTIPYDIHGCYCNLPLADIRNYFTKSFHGGMYSIVRFMRKFLQMSYTIVGTKLYWFPSLHSTIGIVL